MTIANKLHINSGTLSRAHTADAGFDIHCSDSFTIAPRSSTSVPTNLKIALPLNHFALVKPRSGLSFKNDIETGAGVIDQTYTGEIKVKLYNHSDTSVHFNKDDRIAQLIVLPCPDIDIEIDQNNSSAHYNAPNAQNKRTTNGFGSTGK